MNKIIDSITPQVFYIETGLYSPVLVTKDDASKVEKLIYYEGTIDCYCSKCGQYSVFTGSNENLPIYRVGTGTRPAPGPASSGKSYGLSNNTIEALSYVTNQTIVNFLTDKPLAKQFLCSRSKEHKLIFNILIEDEKLSKIGQYPSLADIASAEIKPFRKLLGEDLYKEFNRAIGLHAHGVGAGSYVYLRRIIENFVVQPAYELAKTEPSWNDEEYKKARFSEKMNYLKPHLPEYLIQNPKVYSILSKGIHDLSEQDCLDYFPVSKTFIEILLNDIQTKAELEKKKKVLSGHITTVANKIQ